MLLKPEQLPAHLKQARAQGLRSLYTVWGDEPLLAQEALDALRAAAREAGYVERTVFTVLGAGFDWSALLAEARSMSLFAARRLIELRIPSGKPGKDGATLLQRFCEALPGPLADAVLVLVHLPGLDWQQQKSEWLAALDAAGVMLRVTPIERDRLPEWIAQRLARQGQRVEGGDAGRDALAFFADRVEGNLLAAHQEIGKLALLYPPGELTLEQIRSAILDVARYEVPKFCEAVLRGNVARALRMLDGLRAEGESAVRVHWQLAEDIRALARIARGLAAGTPLALALRNERVWGPREKLFERIVPVLPRGAAEAMLDAAQICDGIVKGIPHPGWPDGDWAALRRLALLLMQHTAARAATEPLRLTPAA